MSSTQIGQVASLRETKRRLNLPDTVSKSDAKIQDFMQEADNYVNIIIKDEDKVIKELSAFVQKVGNKINEIKDKEVAAGYVDIIRELKNLKIEF